MALVWKDYRKESRIKYGNNFEEDKGICLNQLYFGCLARIADGIEKMIKRDDSLISDRDWYRNQYQEQKKKIELLDHQIAGLRGCIKRRKK